MTFAPDSFAEALARCDREQQEILSRAEAARNMPAWLVTLGLEDWEMEKRLIRREHNQEAKCADAG